MEKKGGEKTKKGKKKTKKENPLCIILILVHGAPYLALFEPGLGLILEFRRKKIPNFNTIINFIKKLSYLRKLVHLLIMKGKNDWKSVSTRNSPSSIVEKKSHQFWNNNFSSSLIESLSCSKGEFDEHENRIRDLEKENADLKEQLKFSRYEIPLKFSNIKNFSI